MAPTAQQNIMDWDQVLEFLLNISSFVNYTMQKYKIVPG